MDQNSQISSVQPQNPQKQQQKELNNESIIHSQEISDFYSNLNSDILYVQQIPYKSKIFDSDCSIHQNQSHISSPQQLSEQYFPVHIQPLPLQQPQNLQQYQNNPILQRQPNRQSRAQVNSRRYLNMPTLTFRAMQKVQKKKIRFGSVAYYGEDYHLQEESQFVFNQIVRNVIMAQKSRKRNKRFILMVFNEVNEELNNKIRRQKQTTPQHQYYFELLQHHGLRVLNYAKMQLRDAFLQAMNEQYIKEYAFDQYFKVDLHIKQPIFYKYLLKIRAELIEGQISGNVEGQQVQDFPQGQDQE